MDTKKGARERWEEAYSKNPSVTPSSPPCPASPSNPSTPPMTWKALRREAGLSRRVPLTRGATSNIPRTAVDSQAVRGLRDAEETNRRFRYLIDHGQNGLSVAFDMPTLMGLDSDSLVVSG